MIFVDGSNLYGSTMTYDKSAPAKIDFELFSAQLIKACKAESYEGTYYYCSYAPTLPGQTAEQKEGLNRLMKFYEAIVAKRIAKNVTQKRSSPLRRVPTQASSRTC